MDCTGGALVGGRDCAGNPVCPGTGLGVAVAVGGGAMAVGGAALAVCDWSGGADGAELDDCVAEPCFRFSKLEQPANTRASAAHKI
jgi:hypothetical protein